MINDLNDRKGKILKWIWLGVIGAATIVCLTLIFLNT